jgi:hypothetical protein
VTEPSHKKRDDFHATICRISLPDGKAARRKGRASDSSAWQTIIGQGGGGRPTRGARRAKAQAQNGRCLLKPHWNLHSLFQQGPHFLFSGAAASSKLVQTKVIDNKLKIIDDVPSSAVEMAVKEKVRLGGSK